MLTLSPSRIPALSRGCWPVVVLTLRVHKYSVELASLPLLGLHWWDCSMFPLWPVGLVVLKGRVVHSENVV